MEKEPPENDDERYVREMNETAERDAELSRVKAQLWRRISAAMKDIPGVAAKGPLRSGATICVQSSPRGRGGTKP
jgi:hypothetical protein